jgi:hypothetical protein
VAGDPGGDDEELAQREEVEGLADHRPVELACLLLLPIHPRAVLLPVGLDLQAQALQRVVGHRRLPDGRYSISAARYAKRSARAPSGLSPDPGYYGVNQPGEPNRCS